MPHHYGRGSSAVTPTTALPPEPQAVDPQATANDNTDVLDGLIRDLNEVRDRLSAMMADDFKAMQSPTPIGDRRTSVEEMDRAVEREKLKERECQLSAAITEQRGGL
jgi:hypothetical protein